jgi:peptide subunit release factor 1 (eRF1)
MQTTVIFACPKCGIAYQATQEQHPNQPDTFKCRNCQTEVHAWSGIFSFFDWKAYEAVGITPESCTIKRQRR